MTPELSKPIRFAPNLRRMIWGGSRIAEYKNIPSTLDNVGESWEISSIPGMESVVYSGELKGLSISELTARFGSALLGSRTVKKYGDRFPLLIKFIDASSALSYQVHPNDKLARERHNCFGKSELWYIIDAQPGSLINLGFTRQLDAESYRRHVAENTFCDIVASYLSHPGDSFFLPAGRVHAIGAGNFLAEIQQSSDITYRIYDYDRRDKDGNPRELHTDLAGEALDFSTLEDYRNYPVRINENMERIVVCDHFTVDKWQVNHPTVIDGTRESFSVFMCVDGVGTIDTGSGKETISRGETVLIAAEVPAVEFDGNLTLLRITI